MSNLTISQLPEWTGNTEGFYFPGNNSGETTTYKITRETLFSGASGTSGTSGSSGSSGTSGTSGLGFNYQGGWQNNITYFLNDVVYYNGSSWVALTTISIGQNPPDINANWGEVAIAGTSGTSGSSGSSGINGTSGTDGTSGSSGVNGSAGSNGTSGTSGKSTDVYSGGTLVVSGATILNFSGATITSGATPGQANITITAGGGSSSGESFVEVEVSNSTTTNGTKLLAAYTAAKTKTPYGNALSASNRYTIILPPGIYDVANTQLLLDTNFIDIVGSTTDLANHQITGTITQFVKVAANNLELRNLYILNNSTSYGFNGGGNRPGLLMDNMFFAYGTAGAAPWQAVVEDQFSGVASRLNAGQTYSITGGDTSPLGNAGNISGTISNIICAGPLGDGSITGFAFNCKGGTISFGGRGYYGNSTGFMMNCRGGEQSFANYPSGVYVNCYCLGNYAWYGFQTTDLSGTYINCHSAAGSSSFGTSATRTISGTMFYCSKRGGTDFAAPTGSGVIRLSIDGNNTITNNP